MKPQGSVLPQSKYSCMLLSSTWSEVIFLYKWHVSSLPIGFHNTNCYYYLNELPWYQHNANCFIQRSYTQLVEKSWSMCTPNSILTYIIVIIFMASLFWKIPKLTLNFWWYSFKYCAKTKVAHRNSEMTIFRPDHRRLIPLWKVSEQRFTFTKLFISNCLFIASVKTISGANFKPLIYEK